MAPVHSTSWITDAPLGRTRLLPYRHAPGTSDIHLTLVQTLAITGAVIVSTPQRWRWPMPARVWRCSATTVNVPVLGIVAVWND